ncbi:hypothetical protein F5884DRAFT_864411 [Xylogone sp. PMI_703]|nr:hypothetical protein F5884DRAFT_864411 [Xylogone sp. PMI_703]
MPFHEIRKRFRERTEGAVRTRLSMVKSKDSKSKAKSRGFTHLTVHAPTRPSSKADLKQAVVPRLDLPVDLLNFNSADETSLLAVILSELITHPPTHPSTSESEKPQALQAISDEDELMDLNWPMDLPDIYAANVGIQIEEIPWTVEKDMIVVQLKEAGYTWAEIYEVMPYRSDDVIHKRYTTKLKKKREQTLRCRRRLPGNR